MIDSVKCLARIQKTSEDTTIKNTISVDNLFKYIYTLISAVVSFKSKLVRTSIKITRDTIIYHDAGKRNSREVRLNLSFVAKNYLYFFPERCDHKK